MITLYHCLGARSFRPLWALEELGLPYDLKMLAFPPRFHDRAYLQINPLGTIPLMIDGPTRMTESAAICAYLASRYGPTKLDVAIAEDDYGSYLNWLHFGETTLTNPLTIVFRYSALEVPERRLAQAVEDYTKWFLGRLRAVETQLADQETLCAGRFTMADISVGFALMFAKYLHLDSHFGPAVAAYWARLRQRPAYHRAREAEKQAFAGQITARAS